MEIRKLVSTANQLTDSCIAGMLTLNWSKDSLWKPPQYLAEFALSEQWKDVCSHGLHTALFLMLTETVDNFQMAILLKVHTHFFVGASQSCVFLNVKYNSKIIIFGFATTEFFWHLFDGNIKCKNWSFAYFYPFYPHYYYFYYYYYYYYYYYLVVFVVIISENSYSFILILIQLILILILIIMHIINRSFNVSK